MDEEKDKEMREFINRIYDDAHKAGYLACIKDMLQFLSDKQ